jgi:AcrR family transcriptional regulator
MNSTRKPSAIREKELRLAIIRIQHGRARTGTTKLTIASLAREAGVSTALIHNHYPKIAEAVREAQGRASRAQRNAKIRDLQHERVKNRLLRQEIEQLRDQLARLASINEVLQVENLSLKSELGSSKVINLVAKTSN